MNLDEKTAVFRWLPSMSEYRRGVLVIVAGMRSTECQSCFVLLFRMAQKKGPRSLS